MTDAPEMVMGVAARRGPRVLYRRAPARHWRLYLDLLGWGLGVEHGFITTALRFVSREEAMVIAREAGQLRRRPRIHDRLMTTDVW